MSSTEQNPPTATPPSEHPAASDHNPAAELLSTDEFSEYMLKAKGEMFSVFKGLVEHVSQLTMFFNGGKDMILTSIVSYGDRGLVLDLGASSEMNRKALEADKLFCVTQLEKVKIQFILRGLQRIESGGRPAFLAGLPENVLRLQRREYYRLTTPIARPLKCVIPVPSTDGQPQLIQANVADISGGGLALAGLPLDMTIDTHMEFPGCKIELPEVGSVVVGLEICSVYETVSRIGQRSRRAGCQFIRLPGPMLTLIQRYIIKVERERKARESGMN
jgi:c-di-GMP-binding flagellar brake protein YcgR